MKLFNIRTGFAIFLLFFGMSCFQAFKSGDWKSAAFWIILAIVFLLLDSGKREEFSTPEK